MPTMTGVVEKISDDRKAIYVDDVRYSSFRIKVPRDIAEGDTVSFDYKQKGKFYDLMSEPELADADNAPPARSSPRAAAPAREPSNKDGVIARQNAMQHASRLVAAGRAPAESLFYVAETLEAWARDGDTGRATDALLGLLPATVATTGYIASPGALPPKLSVARAPAPKRAAAESFGDLDDFDAPGNAA